MNYYEHHLGDYMRDTAHLSMLEDAAYRRLLDAYYVREKPLPLDQRECCKLARAQTKSERDAVSYVLREFFEEHADGYRQGRADREIERFKDKQDKAKRSANARWGKANSHSDGNANASEDGMRTHSDGNANGMHRAPVPSPQSPDTINSVPIGTAGDASDPPIPAAELSKSEVWKAAVSLLDSQGMPEPQARAFIGGLKRDLGNDEDLEDVVRSAVREQPADARAWLVGACQQRTGKRKKPVSGRHSGLSKINYSQGVNADGTFV